MNKCKNSQCCRNGAHTMETKVCKACKEVIEGWNCFLCLKCEAQAITNRDGSTSYQCGHCGYTISDII